MGFNEGGKPVGNGGIGYMALHSFSDDCIDTLVTLFFFIHVSFLVSSKGLLLVVSCQRTKSLVYLLMGLQ